MNECLDAALNVPGYQPKIKDELSEIKRKMSGMAKNNYCTVGFIGLTHSISYNVRTTKYNTTRTQHDVRGMQRN